MLSSYKSSCSLSHLLVSSCYWELATSCFVAAVGSSLTMLSNSQVHIVNAGDWAHLQCLFLADNFNLFDHPLLWRKSQLHEDVQVDSSDVATVLIFIYIFIDHFNGLGRAIGTVCVCRYPDNNFQRDELWHASSTWPYLGNLVI